MDYSSEETCVAGTTQWTLSHLDEIHVQDLIELRKQDLHAEEVIRAWTKGVIFTKGGQKYIIANDIGLRKDICHSWYASHELANGRIYCAIPHRTLMQVDHTSENRMAFMNGNRHKSEKGWLLPQNHDRHFSKFTLEIIKNILGHLLQVPEASKVAPQVVLCNWKKHFTGPPSFKIQVAGRSKYRYETTEVGTLTENGDGNLTVLRRVHRSRLDATCLRVCKSWNKVGGDLLYRYNSYTFPMNNPSSEKSPALWTGTIEWRPPPSKPYLIAGDLARRIFYDRINRGIRDIENRVSIKKLVGWVFYDPFLRFLHTIGTESAARLLTLEFVGSVRCHQCQPGHFCDDCLVESLRLYIPIINKLCPNVRKLRLLIKGDDAEFRQASFQDKFLRFLEGDLRELNSVTELVVASVTWGGEMVSGGTASRLAAPTGSYFHKRAGF